MAKIKTHGQKMVASNRKAFHDYHIMEKYEAGIALTGTEVKSIRQGQINLKDSFVRIRGGEAYLVRAHISPYHRGNRENHEPLRDRKLLLHRREINRLTGKIQERGLTVIPLNVYFITGRAKIEIAVAKGKKLYDKRESKRRKTIDREVRAAMKYSRK